MMRNAPRDYWQQLFTQSGRDENGSRQSQSVFSRASRVRRNRTNSEIPLRPNGPATLTSLEYAEKGDVRMTVEERDNPENLDAEDNRQEMDSKYRLIIVAAKRSKQLQRGAR